MQIRFQQSDLSILETHPLTPGLTETNVATATAAATATARATVTGAGSTTVAAPTATFQSTVFKTASKGSLTTETSTPSVTNASPSSQVATSGTGLASQDSLQGGLVAVVVLAVIATLAAVFLILNRMKRSGGPFCWSFPTRKQSDAVLVGLGAWVVRRLSDEERSEGTAPPPVPPVNTAGADCVMTSSFTNVQSEKPLGSKQNPAELEANQPQRLSQRASWVSRMLSRVGHSSISTRSSSRSRWTQRSLTPSGDWEMFVRETNDMADGDREGLITSAVTRSRPTTTSSYWNEEGKAFWLFDTHVDVPPKVRSFDRLSEGTFGRVVVRGRSLGSSPSRNT